MHEEARTLELLSGFEEFQVTGELARYAGLLKNECAGRGFHVDVAVSRLTCFCESRKMRVCGAPS